MLLLLMQLSVRGLTLLMHKTGAGALEATAAAKAARPIIEPIMDFADCLTTFEAATQRRG